MCIFKILNDMYFDVCAQKNLEIMWLGNYVSKISELTF